MNNIPDNIKHRWIKCTGHKETYECRVCAAWTANLPHYKHEICPQLDRRVGKDRRKS